MIKPREKTPEIEISLVNDTNWILSEQNPKNFTLIDFYRGKHCPVCKKQLEELQKNIDKFTERGVNVIAISANTKELVGYLVFRRWISDFSHSAIFFFFATIEKILRKFC